MLAILYTVDHPTNQITNWKQKHHLEGNAVPSNSCNNFKKLYMFGINKCFIDSHKTDTSPFVPVVPQYIFLIPVTFSYKQHYAFI